MKQRNKNDDQAEMDARFADYWDAVQKIADQYRADPWIRHKQRVETTIYWLTVVVFSAVLGPVTVLALLWFGTAIDYSFTDFMALSAPRVLWVAMSMFGLLITMVLVRQKDKLWWRMAVSDMNKINPSYNHHVF